MNLFIRRFKTMMNLLAEEMIAKRIEAHKALRWKLDRGVK